MKKILIITTILTFLYSTIYASSNQVTIQRVNIAGHQDIYEYIKKLYPNSEIIEVNQDIIQKIESDPSLKNDNEKKKKLLSEIKKIVLIKVGEEKKSEQFITKEHKNKKSQKTNDDLSFGMVAFAITGLMLYIVFFAYEVVYVLKFADKSNMDLDMRLSANLIFGKRNNILGEKIKLDGKMNGIKWSHRIGNRYGIGLNAEFGYIETTEESDDGTSDNYYGYYMLGGPIFFIQDDHTRFSLEILSGGSNASSDYSTITSVKLNLLYTFDYIQIGINAGALYDYLPGFGDYIDDENRLAYSFGVNLGWSF